MPLSSSNVGGMRVIVPSACIPRVPIAAEQERRQPEITAVVPAEGGRYGFFLPNPSWISSMDSRMRWRRISTESDPDFCMV